MKKLISTLTLLTSMGLLAACSDEPEMPEPEERPPATTSQSGAATGSAVGMPEAGGTGTGTSQAPSAGYGVPADASE